LTAHFGLKTQINFKKFQLKHDTDATVPFSNIGMENPNMPIRSPNFCGKIARKNK